MNYIDVTNQIINNTFELLFVLAICRNYKTKKLIFLLLFILLLVLYYIVVVGFEFVDRHQCNFVNNIFFCCFSTSI